MASKGHTFSHFMQAMHGLSHFFFATPPLSRLIHLTWTYLDIGSTWYRFFGQISAHLPQAIHRSSITCGSLFSSRYIASVGQTTSQSSSPRHPYSQPFCPPCVKNAARHVLTPL